MNKYNIGKKAECETRNEMQQSALCLSKHYNETFTWSFVDW